MSAGATGGALFKAADGDGLVYNEKPADHVPLTGPQQSYTVQDKNTQADGSARRTHDVRNTGEEHQRWKVLVETYWI